MTDLQANGHDYRQFYVSKSRLDVQWSLESNGYLSANEEDGHDQKKYCSFVPFNVQCIVS